VKRRTVGGLAGALALGVATACGSGTDAVCVRSDVGEVCGEGGDGRIEFSGSGLEPGSEVWFDNDELGPIALPVEADGSLRDDGTVGVLALVAGTEFTFTVTATDDQGNPIVGDITVST
jgi:hypothetical protein